MARTKPTAFRLTPEDDVKLDYLQSRMQKAQVRVVTRTEVLRQAINLFFRAASRHRGQLPMNMDKWMNEAVETLGEELNYNAEDTV